jgi:hemolysin-activating ACP:hemolysin acyltransferase
MARKPTAKRGKSAGSNGSAPGGAKPAPTVQPFPWRNDLAAHAIEWLVMPALLNQQFYLFRDRDPPVGLALWAKCGDGAVRKLEAGMIEPENRLTLEEWTNGDQIWLIDLIAPFATPKTGSARS